MALSSNGYVVVYAKGNRKKYEHRLLAEKALGRPLDKQNQIHHFVGKDNAQGLVICEDDAYHKLLHIRQRVLEAGGDPNADKICSRCKSIKPTTDFPKTRRNSDGLHCYCRTCSADIRAKYHRRTKRLSFDPAEQVQCEICGGLIDRRLNKRRSRRNVHDGKCYRRWYYLNVTLAQ